MLGIDERKPNSESALRAVFDRLNMVNLNTDVIYTQKNLLYDTVLSVSDVMNLLSTVLLVIELIFMVFAVLLLLNFITISIGRKKEGDRNIACNRCPRRRCVLDFLLRNGYNRWHLPNIIGDRYADCGNGIEQHA